MIHTIVCGYETSESDMNRCLKSFAMQTYKGSSCHVFKDSMVDRKYLLRNTVEGIESIKPKDDDIIVTLDADDFLCDEMALEIIDSVYKKHPDTLLTYGSYVNLSSNKSGKFCGAYSPGECFRTSLWRASHLKTFKYKLFKQIPRKELLDENGYFFKCCADRALMLPMMEMAGHDRIKHIPMILYCYNDINPNSVWNTMKELSKATRAYLSSKRALRMVA